MIWLLVSTFRLSKPVASSRIRRNSQRNVANRFHPIQGVWLGLVLTYTRSWVTFPATLSPGAWLQPWRDRCLGYLADCVGHYWHRTHPGQPSVTVVVRWRSGVYRQGPKVLAKLMNGLMAKEVAAAQVFLPTLDRILDSIAVPDPDSRCT